MTWKLIKYIFTRLQHMPQISGRWSLGAQWDCTVADISATIWFQAIRYVKGYKFSYILIAQEYVCLSIFLLRNSSVSVCLSVLIFTVKSLNCCSAQTMLLQMAFSCGSCLTDEANPSTVLSALSLSLSGLYCPLNRTVHLQCCQFVNGNASSQSYS